MKTILILILMLVSVIPIYSHERFTLKDGKVLYGIQQNESAEEVIIKSLDFKEAVVKKNTLKKREPAYIRIKEGKNELYGDIVSIGDNFFVVKNSEVEKQLSLNEITSYENTKFNLSEFDPYWVFGVTLGMPAAFNFFVQYNLDATLGIRAMGQPLFAFKGGEVDLIANLYRSQNFDLNLSLGAGYFEWERQDQNNLWIP